MSSAWKLLVTQTSPGVCSISHRISFSAARILYSMLWVVGGDVRFKISLTVGSLSAGAEYLFPEVAEGTFLARNWRRRGLRSEALPLVHARLLVRSLRGGQ